VEIILIGIEQEIKNNIEQLECIVANTEDHVIFLEDFFQFEQATSLLQNL
jgi:hypothetical protein